MDLGREEKSLGSLAATATPEQKEPRITYPGFSLSDKHADKFTEEFEPKLGEEFAATVRICVTSLTKDEYSNRVQFDVIELDDIAPEHEEGRESYGEGSESGSGEGGETEESDEEESKTLGYKRKTAKKETPNMSAKTLED